MDLSDIFSGAMTPAKWRALGDYLAAGTVRGGPGVRVSQVGNQTLVTARRQRGGGGGGSGTSSCPFGSIITYIVGEETKTGIRGGTIACGDKNFNVDNHELDLGTDGIWLISIQLECEANRDDDNELILGGVKTSADTPEWDAKDWSEGTDYDDNTNPTPATGLGTIVVPLGKLTIADGVATIEPTGCGNITIGQCDGVLSSSRS